MTDDERRRASEYMDMLKHRIIMKLGDALMIIEKYGKQNTEFYKELVDYPDRNDWLVEADVRDKPDERKFYIIKNCPENNKLLLRHQVVNLNPVP